MMFPKRSTRPFFGRSLRLWGVNGFSIVFTFLRAKIMKLTVLSATCGAWLLRCRRGIFDSFPWSAPYGSNRLFCWEMLNLHRLDLSLNLSFFGSWKELKNAIHENKVASKLLDFINLDATLYHNDSVESTSELCAHAKMAISTIP